MFGEVVLCSWAGDGGACFLMASVETCRSKSLAIPLKQQSMLQTTKGTDTQRLEQTYSWTKFKALINFWDTSSEELGTEDMISASS